MSNLSIRVSLPFSDCSGIIQRWFDRSSSAICYEHEADEDVSRTHIHLALIGVDCKEEALKRMWKESPGSGNGFWSFSKTKDLDKYLTYMTKGTLRPKLVKLISQDKVEASRLAWVEPKLGNDKESDATQYYIDKVISSMNLGNNYDEFVEHYRYAKFKGSSTVFHGDDDYARYILNEVRSKTMKVFWGENRRIPHATMYKTVAGSVFLRLCEDYGFFNAGIEEIKNLWY